MDDLAAWASVGAVVVAVTSVITSYLTTRRVLRTEGARSHHLDCRSSVLGLLDAMFAYSHFSRDLATDRMDKGEHTRQTGKLVHAVNTIELVWGIDHEVARLSRALTEKVRDLLQNQFFLSEHPDQEVAKEMRELSMTVHADRTALIERTRAHLSKLETVTGGGGI